MGFTVREKEFCSFRMLSIFLSSNWVDELERESTLAFFFV